MMTAEERTLKPCPFCGSNNIKLWDHFEGSAVECVGCKANGPTAQLRGDRETEDSRTVVEAQGVAIDEWNIRGDEKKILCIGGKEDD